MTGPLSVDKKEVLTLYKGENMKKIFLLSLLVLTACSQTSQTDTNTTTQTKMKACLISEANTRFQAGTLFTQSIRTTADDMVNTCLKKLALQAAGISEETQSTATSIIENLKNLSAS